MGKEWKLPNQKINKTPKEVMLENGLLTLFPLDRDTFYPSDSISRDRAWWEQGGAKYLIS